MDKLIICGFASFFISLILTPFIRKIAIYLNILDHPISEIKSHRKPTPYLGGTAIMLGILAGTIVATQFLSINFIQLSKVLIPALLLFILGSLDDMYAFSARLRFLIQAVIFASFMFLTGFYIPLVKIYPIDFLFTLIWLIGITNAFNIIDIMDGLASGVAIIASCFLGLLAFQSNLILILVLVLTTAGGAFGFIGYNFSKTKKIFMGDGGSTVLGGILGISVVICCQSSDKPIINFISLLILLGIPVYDTFLVMILRLKKGLSPFKGSRDHFALRMVAMGFSNKSTVFSAYIVTIALGLISLVIYHLNDYLYTLSLLTAVVLLGITWGRMLSIIDVKG